MIDLTKKYYIRRDGVIMACKFISLKAELPNILYGNEDLKKTARYIFSLLCANKKTLEDLHPVSPEFYTTAEDAMNRKNMVKFPTKGEILDLLPFKYHLASYWSDSRVRVEAYHRNNFDVVSAELYGIEDRGIVYYDMFKKDWNLRYNYYSTEEECRKAEPISVIDFIEQ